MYILTIFVEIDFWPNHNMEGKWRLSWIQDGRQPTTNQNVPPIYLDPESSHIHNLKPKCVEVDVHMGHNPAPAVQEVAEV